MLISKTLSILFGGYSGKDDETNLRIRESLNPLVNIDASATLKDRRLFKAIKKEGKWVQFEGILHQSVPVALLAKLSDPASLTVEEKQPFEFLGASD